MGPGILGLNKYLISFSISRFLRKNSFFGESGDSDRKRLISFELPRVLIGVFLFLFFLWDRLSRFVFVSLSRGFSSDSSHSDSFSREIWEARDFDL